MNGIFINISLVLISLIIISILAFYLYRNNILNTDLRKIDLYINENKFVVEVADTSLSRQQGLMNRQSLGKHEGMLFVFPSSFIYPFWMKDTLIPLDIIWINANKEIVYIAENVQPCENIVTKLCKAVNPQKLSIYVLEINAGTVNDLDIKVGDAIEFEL